jgi:hypothetical protein
MLSCGLLHLAAHVALDEFVDIVGVLKNGLVLGEDDAGQRDKVADGRIENLGRNEVGQG